MYISENCIFTSYLTCDSGNQFYTKRQHFNWHKKNHLKHQIITKSNISINIKNHLKHQIISKSQDFIDQKNNHLQHELFVGDLWVDDGQGVDPHPPAAVLELDGVVQQHPEQSIDLKHKQSLKVFHWTFFIERKQSLKVFHWTFFIERFSLNVFHWTFFIERFSLNVFHFKWT